MVSVSESLAVIGIGGAGSHRRRIREQGAIGSVGINGARDGDGGIAAGGDCAEVAGEADAAALRRADRNSGELCRECVVDDNCLGIGGSGIVDRDVVSERDCLAITGSAESSLVIERSARAITAVVSVSESLAVVGIGGAGSHRRRIREQGAIGSIGINGARDGDGGIAAGGDCAEVAGES